MKPERSSKKFFPSPLILGVVTMGLVGCPSPEEPQTPPIETSTAAKPSAELGYTGTDSPQPSPLASPAVTYGEVFRITYASCLPCHNRKTLPQVIARLKAASFNEVGGETRLRLLGELEGLKEFQDSGLPLGFTSGQTELMQNFKTMPAGFYTMLEKGVMPPPWAPELMEAIDWPNYQRITPENRVKLLRYAKPYSEKYLR